MNVFSKGRKWLALMVTMVTVYVVLGMSFLLAMKQRLTGDWSSLMAVLLAVTGGATAAYMGTNMAITKRTIEATGAPPPQGGV